MNSSEGTHPVDGDRRHKCNLWCEVEGTVTHFSKQCVSLRALGAVLNRVEVDTQQSGTLQQPHCSFATEVLQLRIWHFLFIDII